MGEIDELIIEISPYYAAKKAKVPKGQKAVIPEEEHNLGYNSSTETLEPVYFWLLDFMQQIAGKVEKITDNFTSSPGSGHFSELMGKATQMQKEAMNIMQTIGLLIKSIINIIYDLREFQIRLAHYQNLKSKDEKEKQAAKLALKQIWMDQVDIKRGIGSINSLTTGNLNFVTLRDAFFAAEDLEAVKKLDLNERVKRILSARLSEYLEWEKRSGRELTKRYSIERTWLKNQVNSLKLYTRWVKPYLKAARQLEQKETSSPELVTAFNTILLNLTLFGKRELDFAQAITDKDLPENFKHKNLKRKYYSCTLVDFKFRGIPQRVGQHYAFGGKTDVNFKAYALNEEELEKLKQKLDDSDMNEALKLAQGMTDDSLNELKADIEEFLQEEEQEEKKGTQDVDPFTALFARKKKAGKETQIKTIDKIKSDNYVEKTVRNLAIKSAKRTCFKLFDVYKKTHGMLSHQDPYTEFYVPTED